MEQGLLLQQTWPLLLGPPDAPSGQQRLSTQARLRAVTQSHIPSGNSRATASLVSTHKGKGSCACFSILFCTFLADGVVSFYAKGPSWASTNWRCLGVPGPRVTQ